MSKINFEIVLVNKSILIYLFIYCVVSTSILKRTLMQSAMFLCDCRLRYFVRLPCVRSGDNLNVFDLGLCLRLIISTSFE